MTDTMGTDASDRYIHPVLVALLPELEAELARIVGAGEAARIYRDHDATVADIEASAAIEKLRSEIACLSREGISAGAAAYEEAVAEVAAGPKPSREKVRERLELVRMRALAGE